MSLAKYKKFKLQPGSYTCEYSHKHAILLVWLIQDLSPEIWTLEIKSLSVMSLVKYIEYKLQPGSYMCRYIHKLTIHTW